MERRGEKWGEVVESGNLLIRPEERYQSKNEKTKVWRPVF
jgi:hypothetical protein